MNKTFEELGYNAGDTVLCVVGGKCVYVTGKEYLLGQTNGEPTTRGYNGYSASWELVSRAGSTDAGDQYPIWRDMTPEAQGALLLAEHNGAVIQLFRVSSRNWTDVNHSPYWFDHIKYRVMPAGPVVVEHELFGKHELFWGGPKAKTDTHKITYNVIDGVIDCASVKMMEIDK